MYCPSVVPNLELISLTKILICLRELNCDCVICPSIAPCVVAAWVTVVAPEFQFTEPPGAI